MVHRPMTPCRIRPGGYLPAILGIEAWFGTLADCIDAAVTGIWKGDLR